MAKEREQDRQRVAREASGPRRESGEPGGGQGRRDEVGGSGVYPASAGRAPDDAGIRTQNAWGQGERGAAGYDDSGSSELHPADTEPGAAERSEANRPANPAPQTKRSGSEEIG